MALTESARALELWGLSRMHPDVPLYSGGLLDGWPNWAIDGLAICRYEFGVVKAYQAVERSKKKPRSSNG